MKRFLIALGLVLAVFLADSRLDARVFAARQSVSACYPADGFASATRTLLRRLAIATSGVDSAVREEAMLPHLTDTASLIYQVSDSAICAAALGPHNTYAEYTSEDLAKPESQRLYLFRYREFWVGSNPHIHEGVGWVGAYVMDSTFQLVKAFMH